MGNLFSKNKKSSTSSNNNSNNNSNNIIECENEISKLQELYNLASQTTNLEKIRNYYDQSLTYICESDKLNNLKEDLNGIYIDILINNLTQLAETYNNLNTNETNSELLITFYQNKSDLLNQIIEYIYEIKKINILNTEDKKIQSEWISKLTSYENDDINIENKLKELEESNFIIHIKRLVVFLFNGYGIYGSYGDLSDTELLEQVLNPYFDKNLTLKEYKYLLKFSEFLGILYPFDDNICIFEDGKEKKIIDENLEKYLNSKLRVTLNELGLFYINKYYSNYLINSTEINENIKKQITTNHEDTDKLALNFIESNEINIDNLYKETKSLLKKQTIEHWKSLVSLTSKQVLSSPFIEYLPNTFPIYCIQLEEYIAFVWALNILFFNYGKDYKKGGGLTYTNPSPLSYTDIFSDEEWDLKSFVNVYTVLNTSNTDVSETNYAKINYNKAKKAWDESVTQIENFKNQLKNGNKITQTEYEKSSYPLKLSSTKFGEEITINNTGYITNYLIYNKMLKDKDYPMFSGFGCYRLLDNSEYVINFEYPYDLTISMDTNIWWNNNSKFLNAHMLNACELIRKTVDVSPDTTEADGNTYSHLCTYTYNNVITNGFGLYFLIPLQTIKTNMFINYYNYTNYKNTNKFNNDTKILDHMFDRCTLFKKNDGSF